MFLNEKKTDRKVAPVLKTSIFPAFAVMACFMAVPALAWPGDAARKAAEQARIQDSLKQVELKNLQKEVDALSRIRLQKADSLEKLEAAHWTKRYAESELTEEHQAETRELDGRYGKLSTDLGRVTEEVMANKSVTQDAEENAKSEESAYEGLHTQVRLSVEKTLGEVTGDYPVGMNSRLIALKNAQLEADKSKPNTLAVTRAYLDDLLKRHEMTFTQSFGREISQVGSRPDVSVNRLRLGTVFLGEVATDNGDVQALFRSGTLQGKMFDWNSQLPVELKKSMAMAVDAAGMLSQGSDSSADKSVDNVKLLTMPMDILQNKSVKNSISETKELTAKEAFEEWFHKGGIVMYPLLLAAIFAVILCLERFLALVRRGHLSRRFMKKLNGFLAEKKYDEAANLCLKKDTSLSMVLFAVINKAREDRESAEKSLQEALLREQPKLERRMRLLAAIGTIAPLLGLLGTVTGIITLFNVITEVGTNDARVLAGGISEALVTTEAGLIIAIPVMILHGLLSEKIERVSSELYVQSVSLLNRIFGKKNDQ